jgi:hypothetical protein
MSTVALIDELKTLELELHKTETRRSRERMEALLHPEFAEIGRSGKMYSRAEILNEFGADKVLPAIQARNFDLALLAERIALLTYVSSHLDEKGTPHRHTLRSSVWVRTSLGWQMRFHQGTPTTPASLDQK